MWVFALSLGAAGSGRAMMPPLHGTLPDLVSRAARDGRVAATEATVEQSAEGPVITWFVPVILAAYIDEPLIYNAATFERILFDTTGSMPTGSVFDYYQWVSGGRFRLTGRVVATIRLPYNEAYYAGSSGGLRAGTPNNAFGLMRDALRACADTIDWRPFDTDGNGAVDVTWLIHAGLGSETTGNLSDLWSVTSYMSRAWRDASAWYTKTQYPGGSGGQTIRIDRFGILPELSGFAPGQPSEIGVYCHEFGHALGLPDLYSTSAFSSGNTGTGAWSLMGSGGYGGDGHSPQYPTHLGAWPLRFLGWDRTLHPMSDTTLTLEPLSESRTVVDWSFQGESNSDHFLIEHRRRTGFDRNLPNDGLIIYHVDEQVIADGMNSNSINAGPTPGLQIVEADGDFDITEGRNRGDANDPFPGTTQRTFLDDTTVPNTRTFLNAISNLAVHDIRPVGSGIRFSLQIRAPGWSLPIDVTGASYLPASGRPVAKQTTVDAQGNVYMVGTELRSGRLQVVLRSGPGAPVDVFQVSASPTGASEPTIARLPGGNLAVVWTDTRQGRSMLYYRSRISGVWSDERVLVSAPGSCSHASISASSRGTLSLGYRYTEVGKSQIRFMRFTYFSPYGTTVPVTALTVAATQPAVLSLPGGSTLLVWNDRTPVTPRLMFARYHPDSGFTSGMPLTHNPFYEQSDFSAVVDSSGAVHVAWQVSGPGINEIHYQMRPSDGPAWPADTLIEARPEAVGRPVIDIGPGGILHLAFEATQSGVPQVRYKRWTPDLGWDGYSTQMTAFDDGPGERPFVMPLPSGDLAIGYSIFPGGVPRLMVRRRENPTPTTLDVPASQPLVGRFELGPNPLRIGEGLALRGVGGAVPAAFDVFDIAGRRVARIPNLVPGRSLVVVDGDVTRGWASGVYFVRPDPGSGRGLRLVVIP